MLSCQATDILWPNDQVPGFQDVIEEMYSKCAKLSSRILQLMAMGLGLVSANVTRDGKVSPNFISDFCQNYITYRLKGHKH